MFKRRLVPKLLLTPSRTGKPGRPVLVTTVRYAEVIEVGDPVSQAKIYQAQAADELIFLDIRPTPGDLSRLTAVLTGVSEEIFMPLTVGGGVRTTEHFRTLLQHGADKVSVNTAALEDPDLITRAAEAFGAQCVVLSIDYRAEPGGVNRVYRGSGQVPTDWDPVNWAVEGERRGAGEILLTCIDRDGTSAGLDLEVLTAVTAAVKVPVIASGGCGLARHFADGLAAGADAVAAGTFFCFKDQNPMQTRAHIRNAGFPIRLLT